MRLGNWIQEVCSPVSPPPFHQTQGQRDGGDAQALRRTDGLRAFSCEGPSALPVVPTRFYHCGAQGAKTWRCRGWSFFAFLPLPFPRRFRSTSSKKRPDEDHARPAAVQRGGVPAAAVFAADLGRSRLEIGRAHV